MSRSEVLFAVFALDCSQPLGIGCHSAAMQPLSGLAITIPQAECQLCRASSPMGIMTICSIQSRHVIGMGPSPSHALHVAVVHMHCLSI